MKTDRLKSILFSKRDHPAICVAGIAAMPLYPVVPFTVKSYLATKARRGKSLPRPVISVGNITVGGTGKTSFVRLLVELLNRKGLKTAVLSKGYKRKTKGLVRVGQMTGARAGYSVCGDEPYMMARWGTGASIFVHDDMYEAGSAAMEEDPPDVFVLDDGFQHVKLKRDLDIVLIDATNPFDNGRLVPFGLLREPLSALRRSGLAVITRCNQSDLVEATQKIVESIAPGVPVTRAVHEPDSLLLDDGRAVAPGELNGKSVYVFSGTGNPSSLCLTAMECGARIVGACVFPDHYRYSRAELVKLEHRADELKAEWLLTTEKDAVRVERANSNMPLCVLAVKVRVISGMEKLESAVEKALNPGAVQCTTG